MLEISGCGKTTSQDPQKANPSVNSSAETGGMAFTILDSAPLKVTLSEMVQTNDNHVGDRFTASKASSVAVGGDMVMRQEASRPGRRALFYLLQNRAVYNKTLYIFRSEPV